MKTWTFQMAILVLEDKQKKMNRDYEGSFEELDALLEEIEQIKGIKYSNKFSDFIGASKSEIRSMVLFTIERDAPSEQKEALLKRAKEIINEA